MTIKEFAQLAGVSASTVSKIMNGKDASISPETRAHVLKLAKEYNYKSVSFGGNVSGRSLLLGVVTSGPLRLDRTLSGFVSRASELGYAVLVKDSGYDGDAEQKNLLRMLGMNVDGLLLDPVEGSDPERLATEVKKQELPCLFLSSGKNRRFGLPYIDYAQMGYAAANCLIAKGHTDIACLLFEGRRSEDFLSGYRQCIYDHGIIPKEDLVFRNEEQMMRKLGSGRFTGLIVSHSAGALGVCRRLSSLHYAVPGDLSVVSLSGDHVSPCREIPLVSSIRIPYFAYGEHLAEYLIRRIEKKPKPAPFAHEAVVDSEFSVGAPYSARLRRVLSVGSVNIDNYMSFHELPHSGTSAAGSSLSVYPGGKCLNQAIGASKLGMSVSVIGRVGDDTDSDLIYNTVREYAVDHRGLLRTEEERTGQAYIFVADSGESLISLLPGANDALSPEDMKRNRHLFSANGYCLLQTEIPMPALIEAARLAKEQHMTTVLKPSALDELPEELLRHIDLMVPNRDELFILSKSGNTMEEKAERYLEQGISTVIVTAGAEGCFVRTKEVSEYIPAIDITAVDVSGAGDAFICCLISYLIYGYDIVRAARIATCAAGLSITRQGTVPALVDRSTLEAYIRNKDAALLRKYEV